MWFYFILRGIGHLKAKMSPESRGVETPTSALLLHHEDTKDCQFPCQRTGTPDVTSFDSFPALICLLLLRTKGSHFKAYFLYNRVQERTYSLWAHLWKNRADYLNPLFRADHSQTRGVLHLPTAPCNFMYKYVNLWDLTGCGCALDSGTVYHLEAKGYVTLSSKAFLPVSCPSLSPLNMEFSLEVDVLQ